MRASSALTAANVNACLDVVRIMGRCLCLRQLLGEAAASEFGNGAPAIATLLGSALGRCG